MATQAHITGASRRRLLAAVAVLPIGGVGLSSAQASTADFNALRATWMKANDRLGAIQWLDDQVVMDQLGREATSVEVAEYDVALEEEERAYDAVSDYQPETVAQLHVKAETLTQDCPFYMEPMLALHLIAQDIARLAGVL